MRKITFILSLLLTFAGITASAQTCQVKKFATAGTAITSVEGLTDGGLYAFYNPGRGKYIKLEETTGFSSTDGYKLNNDASLESTDNTDAFSVFKVHISTVTENEVTKTVYSFESALSGVYIKPVVDGACYAEYTTSPATFEIRTTNVDGGGEESGIFYIKNSGNNQWFDMQDGQFVGWQGRGNNSKYKIIPVTVSDTDPTTYAMVSHKMQLTDGTAVTGYIAPFDTKYYADGTNLTALPAVSNYYYTVTLTNASSVVSATNHEFTYQLEKTGEAPVTFSTADSKTWYKLTIKDGTRILKSLEEDNLLHIRTTNFTLNEENLIDYDGFNSIVWSFVESGPGVKLYHKGTGKYVKWVSDCAELVNEANASVFYIIANTNDTNGFGLWTGATSGKIYLNASMGYNNSGANTRLGAWTANGPGSCFIAEAIDQNADLLAVGKACLTATLGNTTANTVNETYVTAGLQGDIDKAATAAAAATTVDGLDAVYASYLTIPSSDINPNAVYRIRNVNAPTKKYASIAQMAVGTDGTLAAAYNQNTNMDRTVRRVVNDADFMSQLWFLEANADGTFKIKSANAGSYWCNIVDNAIDMPISKQFSGDFKLQGMPNITFSNNSANDATTMFLMSINGKHVNAFQSDDNNIIKNWQQDNDPGNYWQIEKVKTVPLTISAAGYASAGFPFAVQVPAESGVKAYYATSAGNGVMGLTAIEDGIIPANQGVVLAYEGTEALPETGLSVTLTITTTENTISGNKLVAATAKRTGFASGDNYLLAKDSQDNNKVKFLLSDITTVPANKAYLPAANYTDGTASTALAFDFGNSTAISDVVKDSNEDIRYYDLNGRRVLFPSNGIFITNTGKKVLVK